MLLYNFLSNHIQHDIKYVYTESKATWREHFSKMKKIPLPALYSALWAKMAADLAIVLQT